MPDYTHKGLIAEGYMRAAPDPIRGAGFVRYGKGHVLFPETQVVFVGNNATMETWTEDHWRVRYPDLYKWFIDPKQRDPYAWPERKGFLIEFTFVKGEDPYLQEDQ